MGNGFGFSFGLNSQRMKFDRDEKDEQKYSAIYTFLMNDFSANAYNELLLPTNNCNSSYSKAYKKRLVKKAL